MPRNRAASGADSRYGFRPSGTRSRRLLIRRSFAAEDGGGAEETDIEQRKEPTRVEIFPLPRFPASSFCTIRDSHPFSPASSASPRRGFASGEALLHGVIVIDRQRRVVREPLLLVDRDAPRLPGDLRRPDLVIDAPSHVLRPRPAAVRPPRVLLGAGIDPAEYVDPL